MNYEMKIIRIIKHIWKPDDVTIICYIIILDKHNTNKIYYNFYYIANKIQMMVTNYFR